MDSFFRKHLFSYHLKSNEKKQTKKFKVFFVWIDENPLSEKSIDIVSKHIKTKMAAERMFVNFIIFDFYIYQYLSGLSTHVDHFEGFN